MVISGMDAATPLAVWNTRLLPPPLNVTPPAGAVIGKP
jgi:hypothetical protein